MASLEQWKVEAPWLDIRCALGEGPFYERESNSLRFVDIKKKQIHTVSLTDGAAAPSLKTVQLDVCPTVTADIEGVDPSVSILVGLKHGVATLDRKTGAYQYVAEFHEPRNERLRSNDGAVDPHGRLWLGSMTDFGYGEFQPEGSLWRFSPDSKEQVIPGVTIPNAVSWSPDRSTMYFTHSKSREIFALDYNAATGSVSNKRLFYEHKGPGEPDGCRVDVDGNLWQAVYGEGLVLKISPGAELLGRIELPTRNITCTQFVGSELLITSAADDEEAAEGGDGRLSRSRELGGAVFRVDVGTTGLDLFKYKM